MADINDITRSIKDFIKNVAISGKRTATITQLRMELSGLDKQRREVYVKLGERIDELRRSEQINDRGLLSLLEPEFENLDRLRKKIQDTMDMIQELNLDEIEVDDIIDNQIECKPVEKSENLLDSFEVF